MVLLLQINHIYECILIMTLKSIFYISKNNGHAVCVEFNCHSSFRETGNRPKSISRKRKKEVNSKLHNPQTPEEKLAQIETLEKELKGLFGYYRGILGKKVVVDLKQYGGSRNVVVAALMEESELPLSKLVDEIYGKMNSEVANEGVLLAESFNFALVKSSVLFVGQRMMYGVPNADTTRITRIILIHVFGDER